MYLKSECIINFNRLAALCKLNKNTDEAGIGYSITQHFACPCKYDDKQYTNKHKFP